MQASARVHGLMRRVLIVVVAVLAGTVCTIMSMSAASASPMPGMSEAHPTFTVDGGDSAASLTVVAVKSAGRLVVATPVVDTVTSVQQTVASMCESACFGESASACTSAVGLGVVVVMVLLLRSRRDTYLRTVARARVAFRRRRWLRDPWTVLTLSALGVLRI